MSGETDLRDRVEDVRATIDEHQAETGHDDVGLMSAGGSPVTVRFSCSDCGTELDRVRGPRAELVEAIEDVVLEDDEDADEGGSDR